MKTKYATLPQVTKSVCFLLFMCSTAFHAFEVAAQPLFQVPKPACASVQLQVLAPNTFDSYQWDFGNGVTFNGRIPPLVQYNKPGNFTVKLTVNSSKPFRIINKVTVTQIHPNSWVGGGFCFGEGKPDLFLEYLNFTTLSPFWVRSPTQNEATLPAVFSLDGVLTSADFPLTVWDLDDGLICGASDFLGEVTVPMGTSGGVFTDFSRALSLTLETKLVNTATYSQEFPVLAAPEKPIVVCQNDTLRSNYTTGNQWLNAQGQPIAGAVSQKFRPGAPGTYYVLQKTNQGCSVVSEPFRYNAGCSAVAVEEPSWAFELRVSPNPATNFILLALPELPFGNVMYSVFDAVGRAVLENAPVKGSITNIDCSTWPNGVYSILVRSGVETGWRKIVVQK